MVYRPEIDGLRAIAVIAVVGYHYGLVNAVFSQGYIGVDIFFVISGYLITQVLVSSFGQKKWLIDFYLRRVRRILPVLLLVLLTTFVAGLLLLLPFELRQLGKQVLFGSLFSGNLYFWSEVGYFDSDASQKPLLHLWSLGVEEQFYILFPLVIFLVLKFGKKIQLLLSSIFLVSFVYLISLSSGDPGMSYYSPITRAWELALGGLASTFTFTEGSKFQKCLRAVGSFLLVCAFFFTSVGVAYPNFSTLMSTMGTAIILISVHNTGFLSSVLSSRPFVFVGRLSYSLYLWHWPLISYFVIYVGYAPGREEKYMMLVVAFLLSYFSYKTIEKPFLKVQGKNVFAILAATGLIAFIGLVTSLGDGFPSRIQSNSNTLVSQGDVSAQFSTVNFSDSKCLKRYPNTNALEYQWWFCRTSSDSPKVLLWGNSYANQYFHGLSTLPYFSDTGFLSIGDCPIQREEFLVPPNPCAEKLFDEQRKFIKDIVANQSSIETVILAGLMERTDREKLIELSEAITFSLDQGKQVVVFYPHIKPPRPIFGCVGRPLRDAAWDCTLTQKSYSELLENFQPTVRLIQEQFPSVKIFNPNEAFCSDKGCSFMISGLPIIRDGSGHMSDWGSELVAIEFRRWLEVNGFRLD